MSPLLGVLTKIYLTYYSHYYTRALVTRPHIYYTPTYIPIFSKGAEWKTLLPCCSYPLGNSQD